MKALLLLFFSLVILLSSCGHTSKASDDDDQEVAETDTLPKATAIFWIDKSKYLYTKQRPDSHRVRTVKAKVNIHQSGRIELQSFTKPQESRVREYLEKRLEVFRVPQIMLDSGFVKPGEQYVQLRYTLNQLGK